MKRYFSYPSLYSLKTVFFEWGCVCCGGQLLVAWLLEWQFDHHDCGPTWLTGWWLVMAFATSPMGGGRVAIDNYNVSACFVLFFFRFFFIFHFVLLFSLWPLLSLSQSVSHLFKVRQVSWVMCFQVFLCWATFSFGQLTTKKGKRNYFNRSLLSGCGGNGHNQK